MELPVSGSGYGEYGPPAGKGGLGHVTDYLRVLYKRRWSAAVAFLAVFVWGAYDSLRTTPVYQAVATLQIEPDVTRSSSLNSVLDGPRYADSGFYETEYEILKSRALAWRAIQAMHLDKEHASTPPVPVVPSPPTWKHEAFMWVKNLIGAPEVIPPPPPDETTEQAALIGSFLGGLSVSPVRDTDLVYLCYNSPDPAFAAAAANAVVQQYKARSQEQRVQSSRETTAWLDQELADQKTKVDASDAALQQYKETHDAVSLGSGQNIVVQRLSDLTAQATKAKIDRFSKEAAYQQVVQAEQSGNHDALLALPLVASNVAVQKAQDQLSDLIGTRTKMASRYLDSMPEMIDIGNQIKAAQTRLDAEVKNVVDAVTADYHAAQETEAQLSKALDAQKAETLSLNREGMAYANLLSESQSNHQIYDNLLQRAKETSITGNYKGSNIQIIDAAEVPRAPFVPRTRDDLMTAAMHGCLLALALAFGLEYIDSRIVNPDEIRQYLGLPFLGLIPIVRLAKRGTDDAGRVLVSNPGVPPAFTEAVRAVRTAVIFSSADEGARSVVVTSTAPSEGKTVVSTNLAVALAQADQPTLLIDGDMRRPTVHEVFGRPQEPGLSNVLVGTADANEAVRPTFVPNLFVLPAGHLPPNPVELLASTRYREFIESLRHKFAWIIIDAPPVLAVTDAAVIAHGASGVLFVVGAEMTTRRNAIVAIEQLNAAKARFIGAVLNKVDLRSQGYYYSPYYRKDYTRAYERAN